MQRIEVKDEVLLKVIELLTQNVGKRLEKHSRGAFVSSHEALGVLEEERMELVEAIQSNDPYRIVEEWLDVGVTVIFAVASMLAIAEVNAEVKETPNKDSDPPQYVNVEDAAERARQAMIERAKQSNIEIVNDLNVN